MFAQNNCPSSKVTIKFCGLDATLKDEDFDFDPYLEKPTDEGGGVVSYSQDESPKIANLMVNVLPNTPPHHYMRGCGSCPLIIIMNGSMYSTTSWEIVESTFNKKSMIATITVISKQRSRDENGYLVGFVHTKL